MSRRTNSATTPFSLEEKLSDGEMGLLLMSAAAVGGDSYTAVHNHRDGDGRPSKFGPTAEQRQRVLIGECLVAAGRRFAGNGSASNCESCGVWISTRLADTIYCSGTDGSAATSSADGKVPAVAAVQALSAVAMGSADGNRVTIGGWEVNFKCSQSASSSTPRQEQCALPEAGVLEALSERPRNGHTRLGD